jgi:serine/threonine-protein kinase
MRSDGSGDPQRLTDGKTIQLPYSFSPDGKRLAFLQLSTDGYPEIWTAPVEVGGDGSATSARLGTAEPFLAPPFSIGQAAFSFDGRWLAYASNETGIYEVYVQPFPGPGSKTPISTGGGRFPIWSRQARKLFFLGPDGRIMVVGCTANGDSFEAGTSVTVILNLFDELQRRAPVASR